MPKKLRIGVLGTGNIARQFTAGAKRSYRCEVTAVGSRSGPAAEAFAETMGVKQAYGSYDDLLKDKSVDGIYVSAPNSLHHEWTIKAARAGKHVLCEKPFALDVAQAQEMFDAAAAGGVVMMEAFMYLCHPQTQAIVDETHRQSIGALKLIRTGFTYCTGKIDGNVRFNRALGGGALMDVGCYCVSLARLLTAQEPTAVHAVCRFHDSGVDELTSCTLQFPGGVQSTFACGMLTHGDNTAHISGDRGWIEVAWPWKPTPDRSGYVLARSIPPRQDQAGKSIANTAPPRQVVSVPVDGDLFGIEADEFATAVLDARPPRVSREFTLGNMAVLDEIRRQIGLSFG